MACLGLPKQFGRARGARAFDLVLKRDERAALAAEVLDACAEFEGALAELGVALDLSFRSFENELCEIGIVASDELLFFGPPASRVV